MILTGSCLSLEKEKKKLISAHYRPVMLFSHLKKQELNVSTKMKSFRRSACCKLLSNTCRWHYTSLHPIGTTPPKVGQQILHRFAKLHNESIRASFSGSFWAMRVTEQNDTTTFPDRGENFDGCSRSVHDQRRKTRPFKPTLELYTTEASCGIPFYSLRRNPESPLIPSAAAAAHHWWWNLHPVNPLPKKQTHTQKKGKAKDVVRAVILSRDLSAHYWRP